MTAGDQSHRIVVVAATLDDGTERIIAYLTERGIPINALLFRVFAKGAEPGRLRRDAGRPQRAVGRRVLRLVRRFTSDQGR